MPFILYISKVKTLFFFSFMHQNIPRNEPNFSTNFSKWNMNDKGLPPLVTAYTGRVSLHSEGQVQCLPFFYYSKTKKPFPAVFIMMYLLAKDCSRLFLLQRSSLSLPKHCSALALWHDPHPHWCRVLAIKRERNEEVYSSENWVIIYHLNHKGFKKLKPKKTRQDSNYDFSVN